MKSAFDGHIKEIPFIFVDNFENDVNKNAYFLSHYHGDHVFGLSEDYFRRKVKKNKAFIYASNVTVAIVREVCPGLTPYLKPLLLGRNTLTIQTDEEEVFLNVTVVPAGHSLGSVMFLFEYNGKKILYTGDFRISRNSVEKYTHFHSKGPISKPISLDVLYVDTTFQNVPSFPKRSDVVRNVVLHIKNWLKQSRKHKVVLITSARFGYEYVCNQIYDETGFKTYAGDLYTCVYSQFPKELYGLTNDCSSRILLSTKYNYKEGPSATDLHIYFSAYKWGDKPNIEENFLSITENRIEVCFSTHCSRDELIHFINYFKPKEIVGFPERYYDKANSLMFFQDDDFEEEPIDFKISPKKRKIVKEREVRVGKKVCASVLKEAFDF